MIPNIEKILYATDLSDNSAYVFRYATDFAKKYHADITILHVLEQLPTASRALFGYLLQRRTEKENYKREQRSCQGFNFEAAQTFL